MHASQTHRITARRLLPLAACLGSLFALPGHALATVVTSCGDDEADPTTLRYAASHTSSNQTIDLTPLNCGTITLQNGEIALQQDDIKIRGPGADKVTIDGNTNDRVFFHGGSGTLTISGVRLTNGFAHGALAYGGCLYTLGSLAMTNTIVSHCKAVASSMANGGALSVRHAVAIDSSELTDNLAEGSSAAGGAVGQSFYDTTIEFTNSVVSGNTAHATKTFAYGGGVSGHQFTAKYSTFSGNTAAGPGTAGNYSKGGGIFATTSLLLFASTVDHNAADVAGGVMERDADPQLTSQIVQSTISGNTATKAIGGVTSQLPLSIGNSTIAFNGAPSIGGVDAPAGIAVTLQSSILFGNTPSDLDGGVIAGANNAIGISSSNLFGLTGTLFEDPQLGPLAGNGGRTRTHALGAGSPAIDAGGNPLNLTSDQRGGTYQRIAGKAIDMGAFEVDTDHIFAVDFE